MSDDRDSRIRELEQDVARLRRLLDARGATGTLRHQVRNALALMRAILRQSIGGGVTVEDYAAHVEGRLDALLRVQSLLISGGDEGVGLHTIIANELLAHAVQEGDQATLDGPDVRIPPKAAELFGLAIHELMTNAVKFGAMTTPSGRIAVSWSVSEGAEPRLTLQWLETGLAALIAKPAFRGFGIETLENMLRYQLEAESVLEFRPEGLRCTIKLPLRAASPG